MTRVHLWTLGMADARPRPDAGRVGACRLAGGESASAALVSRVSRGRIDSVLLGDGSRFDTEILQCRTLMSWSPSTIYKWRDFVQAIATTYGLGIGDNRLWLGDEDMEGAARAQYALVNLAAFLAQSMKESIKYDACDENNWDNTNYAISNSCGSWARITRTTIATWRVRELGDGAECLDECAMVWSARSVFMHLTVY